MRKGPMTMSMKLLFGVVAAVVMSAMGAATAAAQPVPVPLVQEALIKATLMTFNDANITGNYDVLHAKLSKPFRDQFSPEKLKQAFKVFADNHVDFKIVTAKTPIAKQEPAVTDKGVLQLYGYFDTMPSHVYYELEFIMSDNEWKPIRIDVNVRKPDETKTPDEIK
jgi:opacity protein-like surface antigen